MGFFDKFKSFFKGTNYEINREILKQYIEESITFAKENQLTSVDEFYLMKEVEAKEKLHLSIIDYDVPCEDAQDCEKDLRGVIIWVNNKKAYNPESDEKFYSIEDLISFKLGDFPEKFILCNDLAEPVSLEKYKI